MTDTMIRRPVTALVLTMNNDCNTPVIPRADFPDDIVEQGGAIGHHVELMVAVQIHVEECDAKMIAYAVSEPIHRDGTCQIDCIREQHETQERNTERD